MSIISNVVMTMETVIFCGVVFASIMVLLIRFVDVIFGICLNNCDLKRFFL